MSSLTNIRTRLATDPGEPDMTTLMVRLMDDADKTAATVTELAGVIQQRQARGLGGAGGFLGVLAFLGWQAWASITERLDKVPVLEVKTDKMGEQIKRLQASVNTLYKLVLDDKARPVPIDVSPDAIGSATP